MARGKNYHLPFSVSDLSCLLLRVSRSLNPQDKTDPSNYFPHTHPFTELHYLISGHCSYQINESTYALNPGQLLIIPPNTQHYLSQSPNPREQIALCIAVQSPPDHATIASRNLYNVLHATPTLQEAPSGSPLNEALTHIYTLYQREDRGFFTSESLRAHSILMLAALSDLPTQLSPVSSFRSASPQSFLIDQFFYNPGEMRGGARVLAETLNVSLRHLDRILLETCGMNFREKLNQTKLSYATNLLADRRLSIDEIAHMLGYSSSTAFGAFVKKATGKTPTQLRHSLFAAELIPLLTHQP